MTGTQSRIWLPQGLLSTIDNLNTLLGQYHSLQMLFLPCQASPSYFEVMCAAEEASVWLNNPWNTQHDQEMMFKLCFMQTTWRGIKSTCAIFPQVKMSCPVNLANSTCFYYLVVHFLFLSCLYEFAVELICYTAVRKYRERLLPQMSLVSLCRVVGVLLIVGVFVIQ